ncbi:MAG: hypothetical protein IIA87_01210 [Nanoarchaeota archaeon]|nr:hypothetical protein [Nanoarchaeota archaeon]
MKYIHKPTAEIINKPTTIKPVIGSMVYVPAIGGPCLPPPWYKNISLSIILIIHLEI